MAEFWNSILTEKSWNILVELKKEQFKFVLIGGWAVYLWTKLNKSKDVDIALKKIEDISYLKEKYTLKKNDNLKKYEISIEEIDIDIYAPYFSKLSVPVECLKDYSSKVEGFDVAIPEILLILKQGAELNRKDSVKGTKDQIDIIALLLFTDFNFKIYFEILKKYALDNYFQRLKTIIKTFQEYSYLNLNPREFKIRKKKIIEKMK